MPPATICCSCERPAPPLALTCPYCNEDLPGRRRRLVLGVLAPLLAGGAALLLCGLRGGAPEFSAPLTFGRALFLASGTGLALFPPDWRGVPGATRRSRLAQLLPRYAASLLLVLAVVLTLGALGAPHPWTPGSVTLVLLAVFALPPSFLLLGLSWHPLAAGLLVAAAFVS
jgi:hypothetical protein